MFGAGTVQWSWGLANVNAWEAGGTDPGEPLPNTNMEQFTVNLLAEMGAQPGTLISPLVKASKTTDTIAPSSTITSPTAGATVQDGSAVTISGTATDSGGVVAGVEVSTDNGSTWHPASLTTPDGATVSWTYAWAAHGSPSTTIKTRAVDDSANLETPKTGTSVKVSCPCSIWGNAITPATANKDSGDGHAVTLGVKFTTELAGTITGIRFYKAATNTGTHVGSLWSANGTLLASATFSSETASGWQQVNFSTPVAVSANATYVAGYFAPEGHYSASEYFFLTPSPSTYNVLVSPPLRALAANSAPAEGSYTSANGMYSYGASSTFPVNSETGTNYWVDPVFSTSETSKAPGQVTNVTATGGPGSATVNWSAPSTGGAVSEYKVTPFIGTTAQTAVTLTGAPPATSTTISGLKAGTSYTFKVQAFNSSGQGLVSAASNAVTPTAAGTPSAPGNVTAAAATRQVLVSWSEPTTNGGSAITAYKVTPFIGTTAQATTEAPAGSTSITLKGLTNGTTYTFTVTAVNASGSGAPSSPSSAVTPQDTIFDFATPEVAAENDHASVELGVKFSSEVAGTVTGIRFYKGATNLGTHSGSLWSAGGTLLASATFANETASGWQQVNFSSPVAILPNTTYVVGYLAPKGHYAATISAFTTNPVNNLPLTALSNLASSNGVYAYSATSTFPTNTFDATNYYVDVDFEPGALTAPGQVCGCHGYGRTGVGERHLERPEQRGGGVRIQGDAVHRHPGADRDHADGHPTGHEHHDLGPESGHELHVHGAGPQQRRPGPRVRGLQRGHADDRRHALGSRERDRRRGHPSGAGELERADQQRRQRDHGLQDHPLHRDDRPGRHRSTRRVDLGDRQRPHQRHQLHLHRHRGQRRRPGGRVRRVPGGHPAGHDLRLRHARNRGRKRLLLGRAGGQVQLRSRRHRDRHPLLQGDHQRGHPRRQPVERERHPARLGDVRQRDRLRLAAGQLLHPRGDLREHDLRRRLPGTQRPLRRQRLRVRHQPLQQPPAHGARDDRHTQRRLRLQLHEHVPDEHLQGDQLLGGRRLRTGPLRPGSTAAPGYGRALKSRASWPRDPALLSLCRPARSMALQLRCTARTAPRSRAPWMAAPDG